MYRCPVCNKDNDGLLCPSCGFDGSCRYEQYPTLAVVPASVAPVSRLQQLYQQNQEDFVNCPRCGSVSFGLRRTDLTLVCRDCGTPIGTVKLETPLPDPLVIKSANRIFARQTCTLCLLDDGTLMAYGQLNETYQAALMDWSQITAVSMHHSHVIGLRSNGTVVVTGDNAHGECDVTHWTDITAVAVSDFHSVGLRRDGTVVTAGNTAFHSGDVDDWTDIVAIAAMNFTTVGLRRDGTVLVAGDPFHMCQVDEWKDIVAISSQYNHMVGLCRDGTVVATGDNKAGQCNVKRWKDIVAVSAGHVHTVGLRRDGTVVAAGNIAGQEDLEDWYDIVAVSAGDVHTVGLRRDGILVAAGSNRFGQCDVAGTRLW